MNKLVKYLLIIFFVSIGIFVIDTNEFLHVKLKSFPHIEYYDLYLPLRGLVYSFLFYLLAFKILLENKEKHLIKIKKETFWTLIIICMLFLFFGYGMYFATEGLESSTKNTEFEKWVYLINEPISHGFTLLISFGLTSLLVFFQINRPFDHKLRKKEFILLLLPSTSTFLFYTIGVIEGGLRIWGVLIHLIIFLLVFINIYKIKKQIKIMYMPWLIYYLWGNLIAILFFLIYGFFNNGFPEFSELGIIK
jgi:hypothetical protein